MKGQCVSYLAGNSIIGQQGRWRGVRSCTRLQDVDFAVSLNAKFTFQKLPDSKHMQLK